MGIELVANGKTKNHLCKMKQLAVKADTLVIVSPFLSDNMEELLEEFSGVRHITLYTNLGKYDDDVQKAISLYGFWNYCNEKNIDLLVKIDEDLHGKVYLFYNGAKPEGFVITSGNFTRNGLLNNHEYGICVQDEELQKNMADMIMNAVTYDLSFKQICILYDAAIKFRKKHPAVISEKFKIAPLINKVPTVTPNGTQNFYIKPLGSSKHPLEKGRAIDEETKIGFGKEPKKLKKGDVLLGYGVGTGGLLVGYYVIEADGSEYILNDEEDRWPWKVSVRCHTIPFSQEWWNHAVFAKEIVTKFLKENPGKHITMKGTDTLGALKYGSDKIQVTSDFGHYVINVLLNDMK